MISFIEENWAAWTARNDIDADWDRASADDRQRFLADLMEVAVRQIEGARKGLEDARNTPTTAFPAEDDFDSGDRWQQAVFQERLRLRYAEGCLQQVLEFRAAL